MQLSTAVIIIAILLIAIFIATQVKVNHISTLSEADKKEINDRPITATTRLPTEPIHDIPTSYSNSNSVEMFQLEDNSVDTTPGDHSLDTIRGDMNRFASRHYNSRSPNKMVDDYTKPVLTLPNTSNLLFLIKSELADRNNQYRFNEANKPVTTKSPNMQPAFMTADVIPPVDSLTETDMRYLELIRNDIENWNSILHKYYKIRDRPIKLISLKIQSIQETGYDFLIHIMAHITYAKQNVYLALVYNGTAVVNYQFLQNPSNPQDYKINLVEIKRVGEHEYSMDQPVPNRKGDINFMEEQIDYVKHIYDLHHEEMGDKFRPV